MSLARLPTSLPRLCFLLALLFTLPFIALHVRVQVVASRFGDPEQEGLTCFARSIATRIFCFTLFLGTVYNCFPRTTTQADQVLVVRDPSLIASLLLTEGIATRELCKLRLEGRKKVVPSQPSSCFARVVWHVILNGWVVQTTCCPKQVVALHGQAITITCFSLLRVH